MGDNTFIVPPVEEAERLSKQYGKRYVVVEDSSDLYTICSYNYYIANCRSLRLYTDGS